MVKAFDGAEGEGGREGTGRREEEPRCGWFVYNFALQKSNWQLQCAVVVAAAAARKLNVLGRASNNNNNNNGSKQRLTT